MADTLTFTKKLPLLYCCCGGLPMETTDKKALMTSKADTVAADQAQWTSHPFAPGTTLAIAGVITMHADTDDDAFPAIIEGDVSEIVTVPLEVSNADDLSMITGLKVIMIGR